MQLFWKLYHLILSFYMPFDAGASLLFHCIFFFCKRNYITCIAFLCSQSWCISRLDSYNLRRGNFPESSLWTDKYQPENTLEVITWIFILFYFIPFFSFIPAVGHQNKQYYTNFVMWHKLPCLLASIECIHAALDLAFDIKLIYLVASVVVWKHQVC